MSDSSKTKELNCQYPGYIHKADSVFKSSQRVSTVKYMPLLPYLQIFTAPSDAWLSAPSLCSSQSRLRLVHHSVPGCWRFHAIRSVPGLSPTEPSLLCASLLVSGKDLPTVSHKNAASLEKTNSIRSNGWPHPPRRANFTFRRL